MVGEIGGNAEEEALNSSSLRSLSLSLVYRRRHGASWKKNGACRGDHCRWKRHR